MTSKIDALPVSALQIVAAKFDVDAEVSLKTAASLLDISPHFVRMLLEAKILQNLNSERITQISKRYFIAPSGAEQPVLRTGVEGFDENEQRKIGYSDEMSDADFVEASRKWWRADPEKIVRAYYLPVSCGSMIVGLLGIDGIEDSIRVTDEAKTKGNVTEVRHSFNARLLARYDADTDFVVMHTDDADDVAVANTLVGHFQRSVSGGPIAYL